ncbi:hypothetical protein [Nitrosovibrio sp. Nv6]|uniref:gp53-like domain-containing protein n=1 Tax=Nitrosovibrio sp. Nv6 TaxID=1855340 RepID=UPI0008C51513|nr:hypothetical protein [Nitrosovibrio sp. Nv6]SEO77381.1 hypothetical protein SAMN05216316_1055 [Nitrosovibrio sp. Nv6]
MARNGNGTYSLPAGNPVTSGAAISSSTHNNTMSDIATALTQSIASDGQTTPTANLPMGTFRHTNVGDASGRTDYAAAGQVQDSSLTWAGTAGGTANAITLTLSPSITAYAAGQSFTYKSGASANTGAMTAAISGLATKAIQKNGAALASGDHPANMWFRISYDGTAFQLEQLSPTSAEVTASLALKANLASPSFTGTVTIPTLALTTDLAIANGGTGASTAAAAFAALKQAATETATGVVELATGAETLGGVATDKAVTPASMAYGQMLAVNGEKWDAGRYEQWGTQAVNTDVPAGGLEVEIVFPTTFPTAIYNCVPTIYNYAAGGKNIFMVESALTTASVKYYVFEGSGVAQSNWGIRWRAIGK